MWELSEVEKNIHNLRKSEVKVAQFILEKAPEVVHASISELAEKIGVSEPTIIRFCRGVGFKGFQDFKIYIAQSIIPGVRTIHESLDGSEHAPDLVKKVFDSNIAAIRGTFETLDFQAIDETVDRLTNASKIIFYGLGGSGVVAMDGFHKFFRIGIPCEWFNDSHMAVMAASMLDKAGVFIAISHSGASLDVVKALETAEESGATTVAIVSHLRSPVSNSAKYSLCVAADETNYKFEPMSSRIAHLSIIDVLSVGVSLARSEETVNNLAMTRKALATKRY